MSQFEPQDDEGSPWMWIVIGLLLLASAWYLAATAGADTRIAGKGGAMLWLLGKNGAAWFCGLAGAGCLGRAFLRVRSER